MNSESLFSAKGLLRQVVFITITIELVVGFFLYFSWGNSYQFESVGQKVFYSFFHGVSAFCNAGFSLFEGGLYHIDLQHSYLMHIVIMVAIILGSLGFSVIQDVFSFKNLRERQRMPWKDWKLSSKIAVYSSAVLIIIGTLLIYFTEGNNPGTLGGKESLEKMIGAAFQSVTTRTAGFNTVDFGSLATPTLIVMLFLMFIGASSGSTGGGIKTSTFVIILQSAFATIKGKSHINMNSRRITEELVYKAFSILGFAVSYNLVMIFVLSISESALYEGKEAPFELIDIVFEQISAFATVGLSTGVTAQLSDVGQWIIIFTMFVGRIGTLTLLLALSRRTISNNYRYPPAHLMVG